MLVSRLIDSTKVLCSVCRMAQFARHREVRVHGCACKDLDGGGKEIRICCHFRWVILSLGISLASPHISVNTVPPLDHIYLQLSHSICLQMKYNRKCDCHFESNMGPLRGKEKGHTVTIVAHSSEALKRTSQITWTHISKNNRPCPPATMEGEREREHARKRPGME